MKYHIPENQKPLDELYVALSRDKKGNEGIISTIIPEMGAMPMVFGNQKMINNFKDFLKQVARDTGQDIYIMKYKDREVIEHIIGSH